MKNLSIRLKLIFSVGGLALGYLLFLGVVTWTGTAMQKHLRIASDSLFPAALAGQQADASFQKLIKDYKDAVLTQDTKSLDLADKDAHAVDAQLQIIKEKTAQNAELQQRVAQIQEQFKSLSSTSKSVYTKMIATPDAMDDQAMAAVKNLANENSSMTSALSGLNDLISKKDFQGELDAVNKENNLQRGLTLLLFAIASAFAVFTTVVLYKQIAVPLKLAVEVFRRIALGDLTASLEARSNDEVGAMAEALNSAVARLNETMQLVTESASNASAFSQQLASAAEAIASGAQEQAASLEETAASLEQITATVRQSADNANQASQLASGSKDSALQGQEVVSNAVTAMSEINAASAKISDIISTIDEIAFQTNLLAVNAAVEAARAGDEGRGFAVVASEVRSLAQRSAVAAKEIKGLIQDTLRKVDAGSALVNRSGDTLQGIVGSVKRVTDIVGEIAAASGEQSAGIEQVNTAMTQMDHVTQSNSAQTEELSATAQSLSEQAAHLMDLVNKFTLHREGKGDRHTYSAYESKPAVSSGKSSVHAAAQQASSSKQRAAKKTVAAASVNHASPARSSKKSASDLPALSLSSAPAAVNDASFEEF